MLPTEPDAIAIPTSAIKQTATGAPIVYRIESGVLDTANVQIGVTNERAGVAQIVTGLAAGDSVISGNVGTMGKGMKVQIITPNAGRGRSGGPGATRGQR